MTTAQQGEQLTGQEPHDLQREVESRLAECELDLGARATHHLRDLLREYRLEVSSPGPERPLTKPEHYHRFMGRRVRVRTREAIEGKSDFKGELIGADERGVALAGDWGTVTIPHERIRRSNLIAQSGKTGRDQ
jgi:ribosome maturation factor RimP